LNGIIGDRAGQLGENKEYWMGRNESGLIWYLELQGGSPHLCRLRPASVEPCWTSIWMYWRIQDTESPNWIASCAAEMKAILPYLTDVNGIVHGPLTVCPSRHTLGRHALGWGGPWSSPWLRRKLLPLVVSSGPACVVLSGLYPCNVDYWFESPRHPRTWVMACSLCLNVKLSTSYFCDNNYVKNDYLVVMVYVNKCCLETFACLE
jgi:hypothetical protein